MNLKTPTLSKYLLKRLTSLCFTSLIGVSGHSLAHNNDPLSLDEINKVSQISAGPVLAARATNDSVAATANSIQNNSQEVLVIERNDEKNAPANQRRADVFVYDYQTNELIQSLVDLNTSAVIRSERKKGVQLPLNSNELKRAKQIVFDDEDERRIIEQEYRRITSRDLTDIADLNIKAFIFHASSLPNRVNEASKQCGVHRCAQLMMYTNENVVFEISPIINLSEGVVTQRIGF